MSHFLEADLERFFSMHGYRNSEMLARDTVKLLEEAERKRNIYEMHFHGKSYKEVAEAVHLSERHVIRIIQEHKESIKSKK